MIEEIQPISEPLLQLPTRKGDGGTEQHSEPFRSVVASLASEALGALVLTCTMALALSSSAGHERTLAAVAVGAALMLLTYTFRHTTIAFFNPIVALSMLLLRRLEVGPAVACILSQVLGAFGGALLALFVVGKNALPTLSQKLSSETWIVEAIYSFALIYVTLQTTHFVRQLNADSHIGVACGSAMAVGVYFGGVMNPSITTGLAIVRRHSAELWSLWVLGLVASVAAVVVFYLTLPLDDEEEETSEMKVDHSQGRTKPLVRMLRLLESLSPYLTEFVGVFLLALSFGLALRRHPNLTTALPVSLTLVAMVSAGTSSSAHYNPAITLGDSQASHMHAAPLKPFTYGLPHLVQRVGPVITLCAGVFLCDRRRMPIKRALAYIAAQVLGALAGAAAAAKGARDGSGEGFPTTTKHAPTAMLAEAIFSAVLVFLVIRLSATERRRELRHAGLAVGAAQLLGLCAAGTISGGILNPATAVGLYASDQKMGSAIWAYVVGPVVGACAAAALGQSIGAVDAHQSSTYSMQ